MQRLWIPYVLPGLNEILEAASMRRGAWSKYADLKRQWTKTVQTCTISSGIEPMTGAVHFGYVFYEEHRRRDPSNFVSGCIKIVEDALQKVERYGHPVLPNDGWMNVASFAFAWEVRPSSTGIAVWMRATQGFSREELVELEVKHYASQTATASRQRATSDPPNPSRPGGPRRGPAGARPKVRHLVL